MQFTSLFLALGLAAAAAARCACQKVSDPGLYCGYCTQVTSGWKGDNIYWCNRQGGCDDYGFSRKCAARTPTICDGRDHVKREAGAEVEPEIDEAQVGVEFDA